MLQINNETNINNINYLRYMDEQENKNEKAKNKLESERATTIEKYIKK